MVCQFCGADSATVQIESPEGVLNLCENCAFMHLGQNNPQNEVQADIIIEGGGGNLPPGVMAQIPQILAIIPMLAAGAAPKEQMPDITCSKCGYTFADYVSAGFLGCPNCYKAFWREIRNQMKHSFGAAKYQGKVPARGFKYLKTRKVIEELKEQLDLEVSKENYETAVYLRDTIKNLEIEVEKRS